MLQGVEADEPGIRGQQQVLIAAVFGALPGEFQRVDQDQPRRCAAAGGVARDRFRRESRDVANVAACSVTVAGESSSLVRW